MINLNTNLSSLITQRSLSTSTQRLNQSIEQMTTGFKINHAKDNAANYNITTNMTTKIGAYMVAEDNCAMGLNLISTAEGSLNTISDKLSRLRALAVQTQNGTYGEQSKQAINQETESLVTEIKREYSTTEYNGLKLFNVEKDSLETQETVFIEDPVTYDQAYVDNLTAVSSVTGSFTESEYKIAEVKDLVALATLTNSGVDTTDVTFILAKDLDIGAYCDEQLANGNGGWTPIGTNAYSFKGVFNGNGHVIENLKIDRDARYQGLFSVIENAEIKNVGIKDGNLRCQSFSGSLVGSSRASSVINCYAVADIRGIQTVGCLGGSMSNSTVVTNCYATGSATGEKFIGGLVGGGGIISHCYATSTVIGTVEGAGGLVGHTSEPVEFSYATGEVRGFDCVGGLVGSGCGEISNSYATGNVIGTGQSVGGLTGGPKDYTSYFSVSNCYATGSVKGVYDVGGLIGNGNHCSVSNSFATGNVEGVTQVGGLAGSHMYGNYTMSNCFATGSVEGSTSVGGLVGHTYQTVRSNCASVQSDSEATLMTIDEIKLLYPLELMGLTEANGWVLKDGMPRLAWEFPPQTGGDGEEEGVNLDGANVVSFQVGVNSGASSGMSFDLAFSLIEIDDVMTLGLADSGCLSLLDSMILRVSDKAIEYGAMQNRLESALDEISVQYENLVSSRSTLRDADIAEVSSEYIRQQILQQASATLMATANQSPSIALQLI